MASSIMQHHYNKSSSSFGDDDDDDENRISCSHDSHSVSDIMIDNNKAEEARQEQQQEQNRYRQQRHVRRVMAEYGESTIGRMRIFGEGAGFINFGYYHHHSCLQTAVGDLKGETVATVVAATEAAAPILMTTDQRNNASRDLYRHLWREMGLLDDLRQQPQLAMWEEDAVNTKTANEMTFTVVEFGCGAGAGMELLLRERQLGSSKLDDDDDDDDDTAILLVGVDITPEQIERARARLFDEPTPAQKLRQTRKASTTSSLRQPAS